MNEYTLWLRPSEINFSPQTEAEEVLQNVITICLTQKYSVPMDRDLGLEGEFLDEAVGKARARLKAEIVRAVRKYEPRAKITAINFQADPDGKIYPRVRIKISAS